MTHERKKAVILLIFTLIVGIGIGALVPASLSRFDGVANDNNDSVRNTRQNERNGERGERPSFQNSSNDRFVNLLYQYIDPDSSQMAAIDAIGRRTSARIDSIDRTHNQVIQIFLDSLKTELRPILTDEQAQDLERMLSRTTRGRGGPPRGNQK